MITIFALPKFFEKEFNTIQRNAIRSWISSFPGCEIILFGDEAGTAKFANEFRLVHLPQVSRNEYV